jgi:hypothetical protein
MTLSGTNGGIGVIGSGTAVASTSGTSIDFTSLPAGLKRITVMFNGVSTNGTSTVILQAGFGSVETSGYVGAVAQCTNGTSPATTNFSTGIITDNAANAAAVRSGVIRLNLLNATGNIWAIEGSVARSDAASTSTLAGVKSFSGTIDRVRITTTGGTDTFDAGSINILYE